MRKATHQRGFTLIELVITMAVAMIAIAAIPIARGYLPEVQINRYARALAQELREARALSVQQGNDVIVAFDYGNSRIDIYSDSDLDGIELADLVRSRSFAYYGAHAVFRPVTTTGVDGLTIAAPIKFGTTANPITITFRANGSAINPGVIYLTSAMDNKVDLGRAIEVLRTGKVSTWKFDITGSPGPWKKWL